jgi:hypothetical protein
MPTRPRHIQVEAQSRDRFYQVDLERRTCTCGRRRKRGCLHLRKAIDIHEEGSRQYRYELASALHKQVRRGDVAAALRWADLRAVAGADAAQYLTSYVRRICGEETRNAAFMWRCFEPEVGASYRDFVAAITQSRKKWELKATGALFLKQMRGWKSVRDGTTRTKWTQRNFLTTLRKAIARGDADAMHEALWFFYEHTNESVDAEFETLLAEEVSARVPGIARPHEMIENFERTTNRDAFEIHLMFIEALSSGWDATMNEACHHAGRMLPVSDTTVIRRFPDYAYDVHVRRHRKRRARWQSALKPGQPSPGRLDLRWSGQVLGVAWRYAAFHQHGPDYLTARWEGVHFSAGDWRLIQAYDQDD